MIKRATLFAAASRPSSRDTHRCFATYAFALLALRDAAAGDARHALVPQPGWERIVQAIQRHARDVLRAEVPVTGVPLYTDARHYAARAIPVVLYGAGPRSLLEANAHNAEENLRLSDLRAATKVVALAVADLCGGS